MEGALLFTITIIGLVAIGGFVTFKTCKFMLDGIKK
ncbi:Uncharacterised protein [Clostridium perfringens]|nr:Uncharacterised protein [Clostridium perfringens]